MENNKTMTLGSLFDGSGGFPLAGMLAGITPVWKSEISPFPVLVTHKRLPEVKHYGDVSELKGSELEPVDIITFGSPCFPAGTLVLSEKGYIPIEDVVVGMKVLTHTGRWKTVTAVGAKLGETVILRGNHYGLECTPNHPIYTTGEKKTYPRKNDGKKTNKVELTDEKDWVPAENMNGRLWAVPNTAESLPVTPAVYSGSKKQKLMPPISEALLYFVGRWLGDGWVCNGQRAGRPEGETYGKIYLCDSEDKTSEVCSIVGKMSEKYTVTHDRGIARVSFISQVFAAWLTDNFGRYAHGKTMPGWVFGMPESFRQSLLCGILDSDGYRVNDHTWKILTVSKQLAESIRLLAEIQGYSTTVHKSNVTETTVIEGRVVRQRVSYTTVITMGDKRSHLQDNLHGWYRVRSVAHTNEQKVVYNLTVEDDNSYVADGIVVHNCQDLSIAGRRAGILDGARSSLFFQAIRIIKEMRKATNGQKPRYIVFENVPGAFTSNGGDDFQAVLEAVVGIKEEGVSVPAPADHRWGKADVLLGDGWSVAWRVLDSQHFGVPQRRARIFLVGDLAGERAGEVLFKSEGLSGYSPESFRAWQRAAGGAEDSTGTSGCRSDAEGCDAGSGGICRGCGRYCLNLQGNSGVGITEEKTLALVAQDHGNHPAVLHSAGFCTEHSAQSRSIGYEDEKSPTLRAGVVPAALMFDNHAQDARYSGPKENSPTVTARYGTGGNNQPLVAEPRAYGVCSKASNAMLSDNPHSGFYEAKTSRTLDRGGGNPSANQGGICIVEPVEKPKAYALQGSMIGREDKNGPNGSGVNEEVSFTLTKVDQHAVAAPVIPVTEEIYCATTGSYMTVEKEKSHTLMARDYKDPQIINDNEIEYAVRRLTPTECARLQGFPDWWCSDLAIPDPTGEELSYWMEVWNTWQRINGKKPKSEKQVRKWLADPYKDSDEYTLWGNGVSLPVVYFVLSGIVWADHRED